MPILSNWLTSVDDFEQIRHFDSSARQRKSGRRSDWMQIFAVCQTLHSVDDVQVLKALNTDFLWVQSGSMFLCCFQRHPTR
jgi:hypothetical protein